ncbi:hypothetical protein CCMSSC00406_0008949 [Pleurotus cornucopiae]|uniref:Uncharacterized protein n=1 Tax=Pleurotus cornucopiae TaxID=5321 RepID=A0ACB7IZA7_PLECO|nr:hypothetical protein CCMSSC00406_0008949 [Pleurotus cornucopiae]
MPLRYHCFLFPNTRKIEQELINNLRDTVVYARHAVSMSKYSTVESTEDQLKVMLEVISTAEKYINELAPGVMSALSKSMYLRDHHRFLNFHGQPFARLRRDQAVYEDTPTSRQVSYTFKLLSPVLFFAPQFHLEILRDMCVDKILYASVVAETSESLNDEWKGLVLNANVLLNASVALSGRTSVGSVVQISGYVAIAMSAGSIILGLILVRRNKIKKKDQLKHAVGASFFEKTS